MASDAVFESDRRQSISEADRQDALTINQGLGVNADREPVEVPIPGIACPKDKRHGRLLMSLKDGMLTCGVCEFKQAAPKD